MDGLAEEDETVAMEHVHSHFENGEEAEAAVHDDQTLEKMYFHLLHVVLQAQEARVA